MSTSQSNATSLLPPPGTNYLATIQSSIPFLLTGTVLSSLLIPILVALLVFSTPDTRRHPNFVLNVLGILLGLAEGAVNIYLMVHTMLSPTVPETTAALTSMPALTFFGPLVVESTLVIRLAAVYPRRSTPKVKFWSILLVTISLKTIRSVNVFVFLHRYVVAISGAGNPISAGDSLWGSWQTKLEWILQAVDNAFVSFMFLRRLPRNTSDSEGAVRSKALATRLRGLFLIALSNFVFPVILNLIQLGLVFSSKASFFQTSLVYMVNNYVNIIGVVFATIWSIGSRRLEESHAPPRLWASEASTITSKRVHSSRGSQNFKSVNLAESFELEVKEPRTAPYTASQSNDRCV